MIPVRKALEGRSLVNVDGRTEFEDHAALKDTKPVFTREGLHRRAKLIRCQLRIVGLAIVD
jgi:hypothetical protein